MTMHASIENTQNDPTATVQTPKGGRLASVKQRELIAQLREDLGLAAPTDETLTVGQAKALIDGMIEQRKEMIERAKALAQGIDLMEMAGRYTELRGNATEQYGPCPICRDGDDRFHVKKDWWFCRVCNPPESGRHDYFELLKRLEGTEFTAACRALAGGGSDVPVPPAEPLVKPMARTHYLPPAESNVAYWRKIIGTAGPMLHAQAAGEPGRTYLDKRGLGPDTWIAMGLGFKPDVWLPGTKRKDKETGEFRTVGKPHPAIVIPWYNAAGDLVGIRCRFLKYHQYTDLDGKAREEKQTAAGGSRFGGTLWGWHMPGGDRLVIVCEGELNAGSIWQATRHLDAKVLSLGSESQKLTPEDVKRLGEFTHVLFWMDRPELAREVRKAVPHSRAIASPKTRAGKQLDANDLLQRGRLLDVLEKAFGEMGIQPGPLSVESPETRDLFDFVGMDVDSATWFVITRRAEEMGWKYSGAAIPGGVHVTQMHCPAPDPADPSDPDGDYMIDPETGDLVPYNGDIPSFSLFDPSGAHLETIPAQPSERLTVDEWNATIAARHQQPKPAPAKPKAEKPKAKPAPMPLFIAQALPV